MYAEEKEEAKKNGKNLLFFVVEFFTNAQIPENCTFTIGDFDAGHRSLTMARKLIANLFDWNLPIA
jgi:hypothetical protein